MSADHRYLRYEEAEDKNRAFRALRGSVDNNTVTDTGDDGVYPSGVSDIQRRIESNPLGVAAEVRHELGEIQAGYRLGLYIMFSPRQWYRTPLLS